MDMTFVPVASLGSTLLHVLLVGMFWVAVAAALVGAVFWMLAARYETLGARVHAVLLGPRGGTEPLGRRFVRVTFGVLWIIDGLLQAQPKMPAAYVSDNLQPGIQTGPGWFAALVDPVVRAWARHPVAADAVTIWIQVGLGVLLLIGGYGLLSRVAVAGSIVWGLLIWVVREAFGGMLTAGASWLSGAPGAALLYVAAAVALAAPLSWWASGRMTVIIRRFLAAWFLAAAVLQAVPAELSWTATGLSYPFASGENRIGVEAFEQPIRALAQLSASHPAAVNATLVAVLTAIAVGLWFSGRSLVIVLAIDFSLATWWLAQQFGFLGGTGTDPNTSLPLALLLVAILPGWQVARAKSARDAAAGSSVAEPMGRARTAVWAAITTAALGVTLALPVTLAGTLGTAADANAVTVDSGGGIENLPPRPTPAFSLTDQRGVTISTTSLRGKLVVLTFLDPVCSSDCPLVGNQLAIANRQLGAALADQVEFVAIDSNPIFHSRSDVAAFTESHGLGGFANWHFLWGRSRAVQNILSTYGITVQVPTVGMIEHSEGLFFIGKDGNELAYLDDAAGEQLTQTYAAQVRDEIRSLLG